MAEKLTLDLDDLVVELLSKLNRFESVNDFDSNVVDPFAAAIEAAVFGHENESEWRISELHRQKQKSLMNQIGNLQQAPLVPQSGANGPGVDNQSSSSAGEDELVNRLAQLKRAFDAGLITQEEFDAARTKALGL